MKIKRDVLTSFLNKSKMEGTQAIDECILDFQKEGLKINANSPPKQARVMSWLKTPAFKEYEAVGKIGVNDFANFIKFLGHFGDIITLSKEGNLLTIKSEQKSSDVELVAENFIVGDTGEPKLEFEETFSIPSTKLHEIFKDVQMNKDAVLTIETEPKKVIFKNTGKYKFQNEIQADSCKGGSTVKFGELFIDATTNLDGVLEMSVKKDYPIKVMEKTDNSVITLIVAPRTDGE